MTQAVGYCQFRPRRAVALVGRDGRIVVVEGLCRQSVDLVVAGAGCRSFDDFAHFCPGILGAFSRVDSPQPPRAAARDDGANTRDDRSSLIRPSGAHQTVLTP